MNIVLGFVGENAEVNFRRLRFMANQYIQANLPLNIASSQDGRAIFGLRQPGGFYPLEKPFFMSEQKMLCMVNGYFWYGDHFPQTEANAIHQIIHAGISLKKNQQINLSESDGGLFTYFLYDQLDRKIYISTDLSGVMRLFYAIDNSGIYFSSNLKFLALALESPIDPASIIQESVFHYTIGPRTIFQGISRLNPGETLITSTELNQIIINQSRQVYGKINHYRNDDEAIEAVMSSFWHGIQEVTRPDLKYGLLLSGGLDSRLVAFGIHKNNKSLACVSFGDEKNFEIARARDISRTLNADHLIYSPIEDCQLTPKRIDQLIKTVGKVTYPHVFSSTQHLQNLGASTVSTGYACDQYFGGQAYPLLGNDWSKKVRLIRAVKRSLGFDIDFYTPCSIETIQAFLEFITKYHINVINKNKVLFSEEWRISHFNKIEDILFEDISQVINRYLINTPDSIQQLAERFWIEHHVLKDVSHGELTLLNDLPLILPTLHHEFLIRCSNLPPDRKVDHGIYLQYFKKYGDDLGKIPTGNIPISLLNPVWILWVARTLKAKSDSRKIREQIINHGTGKMQRHGWANFESWFRSGTFLNEAISYLNKDIYSKKYFENKFKRIMAWDERVFTGLDILEPISISQVIR